MVRQFDSRVAYSKRLQHDDCVISVSLSNERVGKRYTKTRIAGIRTPAARVSTTIDFRRAYFQPIMRPVDVDTASASAVAARISSWEASWVAAWPGMLALALGSQVLDHPALPRQTWPDWVEQPFVEESKASPSYAIVRDARGCWEVCRNCHERSRAARTSVDHL
jgi:hypothetical protein